MNIFKRIEEVKACKTDYNRLKDRKNIKLIKTYLKTHKKQEGYKI